MICQTNQYSCSMTLQAFFALLEKKLPDIQKLPENKALDETQMIDKIIARGYNHLQETSLWESSHYEMRAEYGILMDSTPGIRAWRDAGSVRGSAKGLASGCGQRLTGFLSHLPRT